jgi:hypothetical protein
MRDAYAASRTMQEKARPTEHCTVIADKYRDAKEYEALAAMHKTMAEQLKLTLALPRHASGRMPRHDEGWEYNARTPAGDLAETAADG